MIFASQASRRIAAADSAVAVDQGADRVRGGGLQVLEVDGDGDVRLRAEPGHPAGPTGTGRPVPAHAVPVAAHARSSRVGGQPSPSPLPAARHRQPRCRWPPVPAPAPAATPVPVVRCRVVGAGAVCAPAACGWLACGVVGGCRAGVVGCGGDGQGGGEGVGLALVAGAGVEFAVDGFVGAGAGVDQGAEEFGVLVGQVAAELHAAVRGRSGSATPGRRPCARRVRGRRCPAGRGSRWPALRSSPGDRWRGQGDEFASSATSRSSTGTVSGTRSSADTIASACAGRRTPHGSHRRLVRLARARPPVVGVVGQSRGRRRGPRCRRLGRRVVPAGRGGGGRGGRR